jgi:Holliday junction DNA helicase RuvA
MIRRVAGIIADIDLTSVVVDVGGLGYLVYTNSPTSYQLGTPAEFYTHLAVRENALDLYGFADRDILQIFELLIELPKIGPKSALQILTAADTEVLREAVGNNDPSYLSKRSGIGKKTAEKIVAGLKDKFESRGLEEMAAEKRSQINPSHASDTIDALISLGYAPGDARRVVVQVTNTEPPLSSSAEVIKLALQILSRR